MIAPAAKNMIELQNVTKTYQRGLVSIPVLRGVSLAVPVGSMVALMGASGSGKSTLLNILGCLDRPTDGRYFLDSLDVSEYTRDDRASIRNEKLGFCFQNFHLQPRMSAIENVMLPLDYSEEPISRRDMIERARELLEMVGLSDRMDHEPSQLSGGQQQRVAIARALINRPKLLLADEPTGALDSKTSIEILELFERLHAEAGLTMILVTHDADVAAHAKRTIHIRDGLIAHEGLPDG
jgi:ABC-type lipoprotein export system ATPase subunit